MEFECQTLSETLMKSQLNEENLKTTCFLFLGIIGPLLKRNEELKEQKRILEAYFHRWFVLEKRLDFLLNESNLLDKSELTAYACEDLIKRRPNPKKSINSREELFLNEASIELADAVDYSLSSSIFTSPCSLDSSSSDDDDFEKLFSRPRKITSDEKKRSNGKAKKIMTKCALFRKVVIFIIAVNRMIYFSNSSRRYVLRAREASFVIMREFQLIDKSKNNDSTVSTFKSMLIAGSWHGEGEANNHIKSYVDLFASRDNECFLNELNKITHELTTKLIYRHEYYTSPSSSAVYSNDSSDKIAETTRANSKLSLKLIKQTIFKFYQLIEKLTDSATIFKKNG
jgi:hypothetical protein